MRNKEYTSTQVEIKGSIKNKILNLISTKLDKKDLADKDILPDYSGDNGVINNTHITVLYGITDNQPLLLREKLKNYNAVNVVFGKTNYFECPDSEYDIVYLEVISNSIHKLRDKIINNTLFTKSEFNYTPHVSLFYVKKGLGKKYKGITDIEGIRYKFKKLIFSPLIENKSIICLTK